MSLFESYNYEEVDVYHIKKTQTRHAWWIYTAVIPIPSDTTGVVL